MTSVEAHRPRHVTSRILLGALCASALAACNGGNGQRTGSGGAGGGGGTGGAGTGGAGGGAPTGAGGFGGLAFNQCGVAAPLPANPETCTAVTAPAIADFDDYAAGTAAGSYTYYVNGKPPAQGAVLGAILHIGDGSDMNGGTSVISTEMIPGASGAGYALQISDTNALHWGGALLLYLPSGATTRACLNGQSYGGVEFSIKGASPSRRFSVSLGMRETTPIADNGTCDSPTASDCKNPTIELAMPADPAAWTKVQVPWSAFTPGVGSGRSCVPVTGQNIFQISIQPLMSYPPPNYMFQPGPYTMAVDDVRFYGTPAPGGAAGGGGSCTIAPSLRWTGAAPIISPISDATHDLVAVKDPTVVNFNGRWHVYASSVSRAGAYNMVYTSFADWSEAPTAPLRYMDQTPGFNTYVAAPQLFYFRPQSKWYLLYQAGPPKYSTASEPGDPTAWTAPAPFFATQPAIITANGGGWLDFWVICDDAFCHLFFSDNHGRWYKSKTPIGQFPGGFGEPVVVMQDANAGRIFEASNVYKMNGTSQYLAIIEAFDQTSDSRRYFRSWIADSLEGPWLPWQASGSFPFAGERNVAFDGAAWTKDISHGEAIRAGYDETLTIEPCGLRYLYQGADPTADNGGDYNKIPWRLGLLGQVANAGP